MLRILTAFLLVALGASSALAEASSANTSPSEVLTRLVEGNRRFSSGQSTHPHAGPDWRKHLVSGQHPVACVLGCADSRVPPELIFDQGLGDLFVVRVAGNVVKPGITGSLDYAVLHLHAPLLLVMGHENCGAVMAAMQYDEGEPAGIRELLRDILPATMKVREAPRDQQLAMAVEENVRQSVRELLLVPEIRAGVEAGSLQIVGGVYDLESGKVRFLEEVPAAGKAGQLP